MKWDVVVAGGGPAGATCAHHLAKSGKSVLLVEASKYEDFRPGETLPPLVRTVLVDLGMGDTFFPSEAVGESGSAERSGKAVFRESQGILSAWGTDELALHHFLTNPHGSGLHVNRQTFDQTLSQLATAEGASLLLGTTVKGALRRGPDMEVALSVEDGIRTVRCSLVVDATGRKASVAKALGARSVVYDRLVGMLGLLPPKGRNVIATAPSAVSETTSEMDILLLEAIETGYLYSAPMPSGDLLLALMTDGDEASNRGGKGLVDVWREGVETSTHTRHRAANFSSPSEVKAFRAASFRLAPVAGPGWIAVGDSALGFDPLSAEGVCKALVHGRRAAEAVIFSLSDGGDPTFAEYARLVAAEFRHYREQHARYYAMEKRWPRSRFWRRRNSGVTDRTMPQVGPDDVLRVATAAERGGRDRAEALLPPRLVDHILGLFQSPRSALEVLSDIRAAQPGVVSDRELVMALAVLVEDGALEKLDESHKVGA